MKAPELSESPPNVQNQSVPARTDRGEEGCDIHDRVDDVDLGGDIGESQQDHTPSASELSNVNMYTGAMTEGSNGGETYQGQVLVNIERRQAPAVMKKTREG